MKSNISYLKGSIIALMSCLVTMVLVCPPNVIGKEYPQPDDLRSIPMKIVSGIPIWVAGDSSDDPLITESSEGKDQLVEALDAAIARIIDSGQWRTIVNSDPVAGPLIINMADCYPRIEDDSDIIYPFPQNPVGLLKDIIDNKRIWVGDYDVNDPFVPGTFHVFDNVNPALLRAIIDELGAGYGIPACVDEAPEDGVCENDALQIVKNNLWPPSSALMFARLALGRDDDCDPLADPNPCGHDINGFNAALGATVSVEGVEKRRRDVARFTCTVFGTNWYAHVRDDSGYTNLESLVSDTDARLCVGQLSSRLSEDYFKNVRGQRCTTSGVSCTVNDDCSAGEICQGLPGGAKCQLNDTSGAPCTAHDDCATGEACTPWINKIFTEDDLAECSGGVRDGTYDIYLHFDPVPVSYPCVSQEIYGDPSDETELLRRFRDEVLNKTPTGQEIINLYYQLSPTLIKAMREDKRFTLQVKKLLDGILPMIEGKKQ